ncbi:MAG TPA: outer membrane lipoprotein-sorting protein [Spirochaetota bacterium]|nr:outer membrane lipoprotein-sorting protein [Spirochaetota bacterium]
MKRFFTLFFVLMITLSWDSLFSQNGSRIEITAQSILARVDRIMQYPEGEIKGKIKHIYPDGNSLSIDFKGSIARNDYLFVYSSPSRGESVKVLYTMGGEDIWVYNIHAHEMYHKKDVDKYDLIMGTNFSFIDFSNADLQSNYNARITGQTLIKGIQCYRLQLEPIFANSLYGMIVLYATVDKYIPIRIDYHDKDKVIFKFLTIAKTMEKGDRIIPSRYDMLNLKEGTVTIVSFIKFDEAVTFPSDIFRPENLGE